MDSYPTDTAPPTPLPGRVLIIDDEPALRDSFARILRRAECEVFTAGDGPEALQLIAGHRFDLVYLDLRLPQMDGLEVLVEIQRQQPDLPVILFTGHATVQSAVEALRLGAADYLIKPIEPEKLVWRTRTALKQRLIDRRRRELTEQIARLQAELDALDQRALAPGDTGKLVEPDDSRYVRRGALTLDLQTHRARLGNQPIDLPPTTFEYLVVLARYSPEVVATQTLVQEAQGFAPTMRQAQELAKWHVHVLRDALESDPKKPQFVITVRGQGYRLVVG